jgi:hypothetical protein
MIKRTFFALVFSAVSLYSPYVWKKGTGEFRLGKLAFDMPCNPAWDSPVLAEPEFFQGAFTYLAHGAQSFVFASEDGRWTLKLFRHDRWMHPWRQFIRNEWLKKSKRLPYDQKIDRLFCSAKLAFEKAPDLTGLVYIHLHPTQEKLPSVILQDSLRRTYRLDLSNVSFAIQHRARPLPEVFLEAIQEGDREKFKRLTHSFVNLLKVRALRGIRNTDTKVYPNFGFWKEHAIEWDFGNYWIDPDMEAEEERNLEINRFLLKPERYMTKFPQWIEEYRREALR